MEAQDALRNNADSLAELQDLVKQELERRAETGLPPEVSSRIENEFRTSGGDCSPSSAPKAAETFTTADGRALQGDKWLGGGAFADVWRLGESQQAMKVFTGRDALADMMREAESAKNVPAGVHVAEIIENGVLPDGRPYMVKELIPQGDILANYLKGHEYKLTADYSTALLDLVKRLADGRVFAGDLHPGNVYFRRLPNGSLEAALVEADFIKKAADFQSLNPNMTPQQIMDMQFNIVMNKGYMTGAIVNREFPRITTSGGFADILDPTAVELFQKTYGLELDIMKLYGSLGPMADNLAAIEPKPKSRGTGLADFKREMPKLDEQWQQYGLRAEDAVSENIFELPKIELPNVNP